MHFSTFARRTTTTLAVFSCLLLPTQVLAIDGKDFGEKLTAMFESSGLEISLGTTDVNGTEVSISDITVSSPLEANKFEVPGTLIFSNVRENSDGSYSAGKAVADDIVFDTDEGGVSIENIVIEEIEISNAPQNDPLASARLYEKLSLGPVRFRDSKNEVATIGNVVFTNLANDALTEFKTTYEVNDIAADLSKIDSPEQQAQLQMFGLEQINARMYGRADWNLNTGELDVPESIIDIDNVGKVNITANIGGYDLAFLTELLALQRDAAKNTNDTPEAVLAANTELMNKLNKTLTLSEFSFRFDDASITDKILDFMAESQGSPREVMVVGLTAALPIMAAQFGLPADLQTQLLTSVTAFLKAPQSIEIRATPTTPIPFADFETAPADPAVFAERLNVTITANK